MCADFPSSLITHGECIFVPHLILRSLLCEHSEEEIKYEVLLKENATVIARVECYQWVFVAQS